MRTCRSFFHYWRGTDNLAAQRPNPREERVTRKKKKEGGGARAKAEQAEEGECEPGVDGREHELRCPVGRSSSATASEAFLDQCQVYIRRNVSSKEASRLEAPSLSFSDCYQPARTADAFASMRALLTSAAAFGRVRRLDG